MAKKMVVAGATGRLGGLIVDALLERGAEVCALVRQGTAGDTLARRGVTVAHVEMSDVAGLTRALTGAACVVSALQGLHDVIVGVQSVLLEAAVAAGVPRFIPSDYSIDFTKTPDGWNRNLDLRREFHGHLDKAAIAPTSILSGAFGDLLTSRMPLLDFKARQVRYWGDVDQRMDFTTMEDVAVFTAAAALDPSTPRILRIAGEQISARELAALAGEMTGETFELVRLGSVEDLGAIIQRERAADPKGEQELFPRWQGMQYMHNMFSGLAKLEPIDNERYPGLKWTRARDLIAAR